MTRPMSRSTGISVTSLILGPHWPQVLGIGYTNQDILYGPKSEGGFNFID